MNFLRHCPSKNQLLCRINVEPLTLDYAQLWHQKVQPWIARMSRPDKRWRWVHLHFLQQIGIAEGFCITVADDGGDAFPIGMVILRHSSKALSDNTKPETYLWYLADAPPAALTANGIKSEPVLGRALIDIAVARNVAQGKAGRISLHAAPAGGLNLYSFYHEKCGLENFPKTRGGFRNDGRFFFTSERSAKTFVYPWQNLR
jgi:hypothetical protein